MIFAVIDGLDDAVPLLGGLGLAFAGSATTAARASASAAHATSLRITYLLDEIVFPPPACYPSPDFPNANPHPLIGPRPDAVPIQSTT